jgi:hypothetical protein
MKLGTKDVLVNTREMGWGSDMHRLDSLEQLRTDLGKRLAGGAIRVLKQWRGHSGIGVWRVRRITGDAAFTSASLVLAKHAPRDSSEVTVSFDEFVALMAPYYGTAISCTASRCPRAEQCVLCEINVSSVAPFRDSAVEPLVVAAIRNIEAARRRRP